MTRIALAIGVLALGIAAAPAAAQDARSGAALKDDGTSTSIFDSLRDRHGKDAPLSVDLSVGISFSRLAFTGKGTGGATLDARTGAKQVFGPLLDLGGPSVQGHGVITGTPSRRISIHLPSSVTMTGRGGLTGTLSDFTTDLPAFPVIGADGTLEFSFGARLTMDGPAGSVLRGRIPISVDYD